MAVRSNSNNLLLQLYDLFDRREKIELFGLFLLTLSVAFLEVFGVAIIFPFIEIISQPSIIYERPILQYLYKTLPINSEREFILWFALGLIGFIIVKNIYMMAFIYIQQHYLTAKRVQLVTLLFQDYLRRPYEFHLNNNTALLWRNLNQVDGIVVGVLQPFFIMLTSLLTIISVVVFLLYIDAFLTIYMAVFIGFTGWFVYYVLAGRIKKNGELNFEYTGICSKIVLESFNGIKEIKVIAREAIFATNYAKSSRLHGHLRRDLQVLNYLPSRMLEVIMFVAILFMVFYLFLQESNILSVLPIISVYCAASFRLIGAVNVVVGSFHSFKFNHILQETVCIDLLEAKSRSISYDFDMPTANIADIKDKITLDEVSYRFVGAERDAINRLSVTIHKGSSIAFVGTSGAGKSTLVNLLLGLLVPDSGSIQADGRDIQDNMVGWRKRIGFVPQDIYLADDTLRSNIAFGIPDELIDENALWSAVRAAQLELVVEGLPQGLDTVIGENGMRISGGQRQRIAIARALYHNPSILVMDEATSALDGETEIEIIKAVDRLVGDKTIIVVAHRLSTVSKCHCVHFMMDGEIRDSGTLDELLERNSLFRKMAGV
jgi:ATP-binding cassette, subfamily B, bacterial PglK